MLLEGKVGLVTGAGSGIGRATALMFVRDGARVAVVDIHLSAAEETAAMIAEQGGTAIAIAANVAKAPDVEAMIQKTVEAFGALHCASNNAAVGGGFYQFVEAHYPSLVGHLAQQDKSLLDHVHREFKAYLKCGRLEHGFLWVRCDKCHFERPVALNC
ncbi:MAG: SDR family NAD(P)-dependent oxidoreductase [Halioglobus sp.]|jgi:NAD(P)-dependent dehydrogenase (short-subunit alcohol dehydrogenase family)